jgi:hypothetical protein
MSLSVTPSAGYTFTENEKVTTTKLNLLGLPTFSVTGTIDSSDITAGAVIATKVTPDKFLWAQTAGSATAYTLDHGVGQRPAALTDGMVIRAKLHTSNGTAATLNLTGSSGSGLGAKNIRRLFDQDLEPAEYRGNSQIEMIYDASGNASAGTWQVVTPRTQLVEPVVSGASRGVIIQNSGVTPNDIMIVGVEVGGYVILTDANGRACRVGSFDGTGSTGSVGAGGKDTGWVEPTSAWIYIYAIYNPATGVPNGLLSLSSTAPTLPAGYTYSALVGCVFNDASQNFLKFYIRDRAAFFTRRQIYSSATTGSYSAISAPNELPAIAKIARGSAGVSNLAQDGYVVLAGDTNGVGQNIIEGRATTNSSFGALTLQSRYEVPLMTPSTIYIAGNASAGTAVVDVTSFIF